MFYGRQSVLAQLGGLLTKKTASLVTCRGRRRIGKSTLIARFAEVNNLRFLSFDGLPPRKGMTNCVQLENFRHQLSEHIGYKVEQLTSWAEAFGALDRSIPDDGQWTVVLLDEISWMGAYDPDFAGYLKSAWDRKLMRHARLVLVLCGSVSSWIADNILNSTGFVGRDSLDILVGELAPNECLGFWGNMVERTSLREIIDLLSVTGGVPKYLEEIRPELSAGENIRRMCFQRGGLLFNDFSQIFNDVFGQDSLSKRKILEAMASGPRNAAEIAAQIGKPSNGHLSRALEELQLAGFIAEHESVNPASGLTVREKRYRICDNYTRFYLHFIQPRVRSIRSGVTEFRTLDGLKGWDVMAGLQFETFVLNNIALLLPLLGLDRALVVSAAPYRHNRESRGGGCQIDLLVQTRRSAVVVEMKRRELIDESVVDQIAEKVRRLPVRRGVSVRTALVYEGRLAPGIVEDGGIDMLIPVSRFFESSNSL